MKGPVSRPFFRLKIPVLTQCSLKGVEIMQAAELCEKRLHRPDPSDGRNSPFVVEMCSIRKTFLDVTASSDVNFTLREGEICALLGENGAGKTTLMNILFGYYAADGGEIRIREKRSPFRLRVTPSPVE